MRIMQITSTLNWQLMQTGISPVSNAELSGRDSLPFGETNFPCFVSRETKSKKMK